MHAIQRVVALWSMYAVGREAHEAPLCVPNDGRAAWLSERAIVRELRKRALERVCAAAHFSCVVRSR
jgi:hypothetical protein